jgi:tetratricopeptide (TPR) repeat protein
MIRYGFAALSLSVFLIAGGAGPPALAGAGENPALATIVDIIFVIMSREEGAERRLADGRYADAAKQYREVLALKRQRFGTGHVEYAKSLLGLARAEMGLGRAAEALPLQEQAVGIREAKLGPDHWLVAAALNDMVATLTALGRHDDAVGAARRDMAIHEKHLGPDHLRLGGLWLRYAGLLGKAGRDKEAAEAEARGHGIYAAAPQGGPEVMAPKPARRAAIKTVTSGDVSAHFGGRKPDDGPLRFGVESLWFTFAGDDRAYPFQPKGELFFSDWRFDIFSPDGKRVLLLQDHYGPYHVMQTARLKDYLKGRAGPDDVVGRIPKPGEAAAVHSDGRWASDKEIHYVVACCGGRREATYRIHFWGYEPKSSLDMVLDYRPGLRQRILALPAPNLAALPALVRALRDHQGRARAKPGRWEKGKVMEGAEAREYVPSDDELLAAEAGARIANVVSHAGPGKAARVLADAGVPGGEIAYDDFTFRHADVMGTGRFFYASRPRPARVTIGN